MVKKLLGWIGIATCALSSVASSYKVCDFENYETGYAFPIWNVYNSPIESTAIVEADPANPSNKVLHITLKNWNDYVEFTLPSELAGTNLTDKYEVIRFNTRRHAQDPCGEWKHFDVFLGSDKLYDDEGWPAQGPVSVWSAREYPLAAVPAGNSSTAFRIGYNSENTDYYIDDVTLASLHEDYVIFEDGELNFSNPNSTSSSYTYFSTPINIPTDKYLNVYTSRYTYWTSPMIGEGRLNMYCGGERTYLGGEKGTTYPDWSGYIGPVHIYPWPEVNPNVKAGFYGVVMAHGNKKFNSDKIAESLARKNVANIWENNVVTLHEGATLASEGNSTARAHRIGTLNALPGSRITGYFKNSAYRVYYILGCSGSDSELAGEISPMGENAPVGIIKEGKGTYRISGNNNNISGGLTIIGGRVLIANDMETAKREKLPGATGTSAGSIATVTVYPEGTLGGNGNIAGLTDVFGSMEPGETTPSILTLADYVANAKVDLRLRPSSRLKMKINSSASFDRITATGAVNFYNITPGFTTSNNTPILEIIVPENHSLKAGDSFELLSASSKSGLNNIDWNFRVQYPKYCTWKVEEKSQEGRYCVVATVVSLAYSGQGDNQIIDEGDEGGDNTDYYVDYYNEQDYPEPLKYYADKGGNHIGVAASTWRYDLNDASSERVKTISEEFNMIVAENEMKIDATEPSKGNFSFSGGDKIVNLGERNEMYIRGHTLVWHSQCPAWITADGYKNDHNYTRAELLDIMYNHIEGVMKHYKGRVHEWDVVNEMLSDDQGVVYGNPNAYSLRTSIWKNVIGTDYIKLAFEKAHQVDPDCKLFINEYGAEFIGDAKSEALFNLARELVARGVPIHGVGLQCHFTTGGVDVNRLAANIRRYKELGLEVVITELDLAQNNTQSPDAADIQAAEYGAIVNAALSQSNCSGVLLWGISDADSWRDNKPLIFDANMNRKSAYYAVHAALRLVAERRSEIEEVESEIVENHVIRSEYFNLQGLKVSEHSRGLIIRRDYHSDGSISHSKIMK